MMRIVAERSSPSTQVVDSRRVEVEHARQVLALVAIDQRDAMTAQRQLGTEHLHGGRTSHATLRVQDRQRR